MSDPAAFRNADILAVYPDPTCFQTAKRHMQDCQPIDKHHILGRGGKHDRHVFSSILNCALLRRDVHEGPLRDALDQRAVYVRIARDRVMAAVARGEYVLVDADRAFLLLCAAQGL